MLVAATAPISRRLGLDLSRTRSARLPDGHPPVLLLVIDTEEEFDWQRPFNRAERRVSAMQAARAVQTVFEALGVRPTYVIDHPIASDPASAAVVAEFAASGAAEIGAHLHPWVTPPYEECVNARNSYAGNLDVDLERRKLESLVDAIARGTGVRPTTFKAGRYGIAEDTVAALGNLGFTADLSTSPGFDWSGDGGPDFRTYPNGLYWIEAPTPILEVPTSGGFYGPLRRLGAALAPIDNGAGAHERFVSKLLRNLRLMRRAMLTPEGFDLWELQRLADALLADGERVLTLSLHSPSLAVGHTPFVRSEDDRERFIGCIRDFVRWFLGRNGAISLTAAQLRAVVR